MQTLLQVTAPFASGSSLSIGRTSSRSPGVFARPCKMTAWLSGGMRGLPQPQAAPGGRGGIVSSQPYFSSTMNASVRH